jgi:alpha-tubulin suppressor-like RCC1 family protein
MMNKKSIRSIHVISLLAVAAFACSSTIPTVSVPTKTKEPVQFTKVDPTSDSTQTATVAPSPTFSATPAPLLYAKAVSAGYFRTCVISLSGRVYCWGQWALENTEVQYHISLEPVEVAGFEGAEIVQISVADANACAVTSSGGAKCWGSNLEGQLGDGLASGQYSYTAVDVDGLTSGVKQVSASSHYACALLDSGGVKCWGLNVGGTLGNNTYYVGESPSDVIGLSGVSDISVGFLHSCSLLTTGGVRCWGAQSNGLVLGSGHDGQQKWSVLDVQGLSSGVSAIAVGDRFSCAVMENGGIKCWGLNGNKCLGDGTKIDRPNPVDVVGLERPAIAVAANSYAACALLDDGSVECWGANFLLRPFEDGEISFSTATPIPGFDKKVTSISVGIDHACAIMEDQSVMCWGSSYYGQLGVGSVEDSFPPTVVLCPTCR